jgi:hypothetical protein
MSTLAVNTITNAAGGNTAQINGMTPTADSLQGFRNRIINGDMRIDQRNAGASRTVTDASYVTVDRFRPITEGASSVYSVQQNAGSVTPPTGFSNYLGATVLSAQTVSGSNTYLIAQYIEGFNCADFAWGTASAQAVTLSFWVRSSLTGTLGGSVQNSAENRSYPFSYTINAANTWEYKTITIPGDTTGTWLTGNDIGLRLNFGLGLGATRSGTAGAWAGSDFRSATGATSVVGTSGATWFITGVQLEAGSVATPFERRDYGRELIMCQRYFETGFSKMYGQGLGSLAVSTNFKVQKRSAPTLTYSAPPVGMTNSQPTSNEGITVDGFAVFKSGQEVGFSWTSSAEL